MRIDLLCKSATCIMYSMINLPQAHGETADDQAGVVQHQPYTVYV